ncbi:clotting factor B-like [Oppia nitens]|uniref:clotting factor B-like n=1 Tax=Oppia nitens TaxID=1686743 RepID=UPI0023DA7E96|nr:clotting factor B-like [Oppia nitens]
MDSIISPEGCGVGRESVLMNGQCFRWYANYTQQQDIQFGRSAKPGEVPVDQLYAHPDYISGEETKSDIGLIKLKQWKPLPTKPNTINLMNAICLPTNSSIKSSSSGRYTPSSDRYKPSENLNQLALVAGFGDYDNDGPTVDLLHMGWVYLVYNNDELNYYIRRYPKYNGTSICSGDSGGPLYQYINGRAVLIGIAQGTHKTHTSCLNTNDYNKLILFVRILPHLDWITNIVSNN